MAARQHRNFVIEPVPLKFLDDLLREFRQKRQIILRINDERLPRPARRIA